MVGGIILSGILGFVGNVKRGAFDELGIHNQISKLLYLLVDNALTYWPNVGPFGPSLPQPPNLTSLRKLQYTSARTNVTHTSIVAHAT